MRAWIYVLAGITFAIVGWICGQFLLTDLGWRGQFSSEPVMLPCVALWLAGGMVITDIFLSNPTRPKQNLQTGTSPVLIAIGLGLVIGLIVGGMCYFITIPSTRFILKFKDADVRKVGWILVGLAVALSEALAWWRRTFLSAKAPKQFYTRLAISIITSLLATLVASNLFEWLRYINIFAQMQRFEDPIGLIILGGCLGLAFGFSTSPSYIVTLRAGAGFEVTGENQNIKAKLYELSFVSEYQHHKIEEGMSIRLPTKGEIFIGSNDTANIWLDNVADNLASLKLTKRETFLCPNLDNYKKIYLNGYPLLDNEYIRLQHNTVLTFYCEDGINYYRFVYYNRFLDSIY